MTETKNVAMTKEGGDQVEKIRAASMFDEAKGLNDVDDKKRGAFNRSVEQEEGFTREFLSPNTKTKGEKGLHERGQ